MNRVTLRSDTDSAFPISIGSRSPAKLTGATPAAYVEWRQGFDRLTVLHHPWLVHGGSERARDMGLTSAGEHGEKLRYANL